MMGKSIKNSRRYSAIVVAAVMGATLIGAGAKVYASPVYTVSLDVNPGIEMGVNMFDVVVSVDTNEDAEAVLDGVDLQDMNVQDAVEAAVDSIAQAGYFDETGNEIYISATSETDQDAADELADELGTAAEDQLAEDGVEAEVNAEGIGYQRVQEAKALSETLGFEVTPGKYNLLSRMLESQNTVGEAAADAETPGITKEMAEMPVKDIMVKIKSDRTAVKTAENAAADETNADETTAVDEAAVDEAAPAAETQPSVKSNGKSDSNTVKSQSQKGNNGKSGK
jgi:hypothetical protein